MPWTEQVVMSSRNADDVQVAEYQRKIKDHFPKSTELIFEFQDVKGKNQLDLVTINPRHNQSFLFHSTQGVSRLDAIEKMWDYVHNYKDRENSYTIQWKLHGERELQTSYFRAKNIYEALDKLNYGRDMNTLTVFSVRLNPTS